MTSGRCSKAGRSRRGEFRGRNGLFGTSASGKKSLTGAGLATAATVLLMLGALGAWRYYSDWRLGRVVLTTDGPSLSAQLLNEARDEPIGEPFSIGARSILALPAGDYRLRVQAPGMMGQTYRLAFNRGETVNASPDALRRPLAGRRDHPRWSGRRRRADSGQERT